MKFLLFSDYHYTPRYYRTLGLEGIRIMQKHAEEAGCDMMIHCGDFTSPTEYPDFVKAYNDFHIPSYHCFGNHDMDECSMEEAMRAYNMPNDYYHFDMGGYRFIVTNTSYFHDGEKFQPYSNKNYMNYPDTRETMPPEQLNWLKETIESSPYPCILFSHASFERCNGLVNYREVQDIIDNANKKKHHSVLMSINGHHHRDFIRVRNNVIYYDMNSASMDWTGGVPHNGYPQEACGDYELMQNTICFNDPLHAIITLEGSTVTIEGMESSMLLGITRESLGLPIYDPSGRPVTPSVTSEKITLG